MERKTSQIADRVEQEHESLRELLESVSQSFSRPPAEELSDWKLDLVWELRDLRNVLVKHFDLEEDGGFMDDLIARSPHEWRRVDTLESEHGEFLDELDEITGDLKRITDSADLTATRERLAAFVKKLHEHEASERDLIYTVYFQDFGVGD